MQEPKHFSKEDFFYSFYGALFIGFVFTFNRILLDLVKVITIKHIFAIIIFTAILTSFQIYYIGWLHVKQKEKRPFHEFWAKRFITVYLVSIITATFLIYLYGINNLIGSLRETVEAIIIVSMPCSLGATLSDLFRKVQF